MKKFVLTKEMSQTLFELFDKKWGTVEDIYEWLNLIESLGIERIKTSAENSIEMWWSFVDLINKRKEIVCCKCPSVDWEDEQDPDFAVLAVPVKLAEKILILGMVPNGKTSTEK
jgi:hypothetical protein